MAPPPRLYRASSPPTSEWFPLSLLSHCWLPLPLALCLLYSNYHATRYTVTELINFCSWINCVTAVRYAHTHRHTHTHACTLPQSVSPDQSQPRLPGSTVSVCTQAYRSECNEYLHGHAYVNSHVCVWVCVRAFTGLRWLIPLSGETGPDGAWRLAVFVVTGLMMLFMKFIDPICIARPLSSSSRLRCSLCSIFHVCTSGPDIHVWVSRTCRLCLHVTHRCLRRERGLSESRNMVSGGSVATTS